MIRDVGGTGRAVLRRWAADFEAIGSKGPGRKAMAAVSSLLVSSTVARMQEARTPSGQFHKPLSREWKLYKVKHGYSPNIWQYKGQSLKRVTSRVLSTKTAVILINTPYSGYVNADRPVLGLSRGDVKGIERILLTAYKQQIDKGRL